MTETLRGGGGVWYVMIQPFQPLLNHHLNYKQKGLTHLCQYYYGGCDPQKDWLILLEYYIILILKGELRVRLVTDFRKQSGRL